MKSKSLRRGLDSLIIPDGGHISAGQLSPDRQDFKNGKLQYFKIHVNADAIISGKDIYGNAFVNMAVSKGKVPYPLSIISACDQTFFIIHDGKLVDAMQSPA